MAKKQQSSPVSKERKKLYVLGALLGVLVAVSAYNFWPQSRRPAPPGAAPPQSGRVRNSDLKAKQGAEQATAEGELGAAVELPLAMVPVVDVSIARNIFAYPPPPPPVVRRAPPPVTPPPPPVSVGGVSPSSAIAGTSKPITITVTGAAFQPDFQIVWDGRALQTQVLGESMLRATLQPSDIASPRAVTVEVKSASQPTRLWSRKLTFQLQPGPDPSETFTYTGRIGGEAVITFKDTSKRPVVVGPGATINGTVPWRVLSVDPNRVELLDTRNEIRKTLTLAPKANG